MQRSDHHHSADDTRPNPLAEGSRPVKVEENTGLFDIRTLANVTKKRITARHESQHEADQALLASTSGSFSMSAFAMPDPQLVEEAPAIEPAFGAPAHEVGEADVMTSAPAMAPSPAPAAPAAPPALATGTAPGMTAMAAPSAAMPAQPQPELFGSSAPLDKPTPGWVYAVAVGVVLAGVGGFFGYQHFAGGDGGGQTAAPALAAADDSDEAPAVEPLAEEAAPTAEPLTEEVEEPEQENVAEPDEMAEPAIEPEDEPQPDERKNYKRAAKKAPKKSDAAAMRDALGHRKLQKKEAVTVADQSKGDKDINELLDVAAEGKVLGTAKVEKKESKPSKTELTRTDVKSAMGPVTAAAKGCYNLYEQAGTVQIRFTVRPDGKLSKAHAVGKFKGTDTGKCVTKAVKRAKFPAYAGAPQSFTYPFLLSP